MSKETGRFLSYVLRHAPERIGLELGPEGWVAVDELIARMATAGRKLDRAELRLIVETNDKKRFTLSEDGHRIRAAQGHSVTVDLGLAAAEPPAILFHGTAVHVLPAILAEGLKPRSRLQVHLSRDEATALKVGARHGAPAVLQVAAGQMHADGLAFYLADNGVWLTDHVPPRFLTRLS